MFRLLLLWICLSAVAGAQSVRVQGEELSYKLVEGRQMVARSDLARVFPQVQDGEGFLDLEEFTQSPLARVLRRNGLIVSLRFHDPKLAALYAAEQTTRRQARSEPIVQNQAQTEGVENFRLVMDEIVRLTNLEREKYGALPLHADANLEDAATGHSQEMAQLTYFSHDSPVQGRAAPRDRMVLTGIRPRATGENIAKFDSYPLQTLARNAVQGWMNSPPHRKNILNPMFTHIGVGVGKSGKTYYLTQNFCSY